MGEAVRKHLVVGSGRGFPGQRWGKMCCRALSLEFDIRV